MNVIIDYKVGNILSIQSGFNRVGLQTVISSDKTLLKSAEVLILPGVGAFKDAMNDLSESGFIPIIMDHISKGKLLIGICLGMQLLFDSSDEFGYTKGLGILQGNIEKLDINYKVPHMGWNTLEIVSDDNIVNGVLNGDFVYFIHSYYANMSKKDVIAYSNYGINIPAIVRNENVIGMQFHPEKSGKVGLQLLRNIKELTL